VLSGEATNSNFTVFILIRSGVKPTIYYTRDEHAKHYTTDAVGRLRSLVLHHIQHYAINIMVYRKMLYFHWILDPKIYIKWSNDYKWHLPASSSIVFLSYITCLLGLLGLTCRTSIVPCLYLYCIMAYQGTKCNFFELVGKINTVSWKNLDWSWNVVAKM
jgi:hypothetical protein